MKTRFNKFMVSTLAGIIILFVGCNDDAVSPTTTSASISALNCSSSTFSATPVAGTAFTGTATVPYTGGNGASYASGSAITSTGVTGLTATLTAGTLASGAGSVIYAITGTPSASGTASFSISVGGQTCTLTLTVNATGSTSTSGTAWAFDTEIANIVAMAEAFKATLSSTQLSSLQDT